MTSGPESFHPMSGAQKRPHEPEKAATERCACETDYEAQATQEKAQSDTPEDEYAENHEREENVGASPKGRFEERWVQRLALKDTPHHAADSYLREGIVGNHTLSNHLSFVSCGITAISLLGFGLSSPHAGLSFLIVYSCCWLVKGLAGFVRRAPGASRPDEKVRDREAFREFTAGRLMLSVMALSLCVVIPWASPDNPAFDHFYVAKLFLAMSGGMLCGLSDIVCIGACRAHRREEVAR